VGLFCAVKQFVLQGKTTDFGRLNSSFHVGKSISYLAEVADACFDVWQKGVY